MTKICPVCRQPPHDAMLVKCERCKLPFVDEASLKLSLSPDELRRVATHILRSWKFWAPLCLGLIAAAWLALQLVDYTTGRKAQDVIDSISANVSNRLEQADETMASTIASRFEEPRIAVLMREVAAERASALMSQQIAPEVATFKEDIAAQLTEIDQLVEATRLLKKKSEVHEKAIQDVLTTLETRLSEVSHELKKAESMRNDLKEISDFTMLVVRTMGDDISAFDELSSKGANPGYRFRKEAVEVVCSVQIGS